MPVRKHVSDFSPICFKFPDKFLEATKFTVLCLWDMCIHSMFIFQVQRRFTKMQQEKSKLFSEICSAGGAFKVLLSSWPVACKMYGMFSFIHNIWISNHVEFNRVCRKPSLIYFNSPRNQTQSVFSAHSPNH